MAKDKKKKEQTEKQPKDSSLGDNIWVLVPLAALSLPIIATAGADSPVAIAIAIVAVIAAVALAAGLLMEQRHKLRMREIQAEVEMKQLDTAQIEQTNRLLEQNTQLEELRAAVRSAELKSEAAPLRNPETL